MSKEQLIDLDKEQLGLIKEIIKCHIPNKTVWAYGSRVTWKAEETSDFDLAVFDCSSKQFLNLKEAFEESPLLVSVDVMDWESIPEKFKENIKKKYVVLQEKPKLEGWREMNLSEVAEIIGGGTPKTNMPEYWDGDIPWLSPPDFTGSNRWVTKTNKTITKIGFNNSSTKILKKGDLIISARGTVGALAQIKKPMAFSQTNYGLRAKVKFTSNDFLFYLLKYNLNNLKRLSYGAVFDTITRSTFDSIEINLPPLPEQKVIAEVLSSLDDKIDLLHRQNKTLEDMAQALFRKWFVEETDEAWEKKPLDKMADYLNGLACQKHPPKNRTDKLPVLKIKELKNGIDKNSDWATSEVENKYIVKQGDIIFSWSGSLMVKLWDGGKCVLNQHLFKVSSAPYPKWYVYLWTKHHIDKFVQIAKSKATTMGHIKRGDLSDSLILIPTCEALKEMDRVVSPLIEAVILNFEQIHTLKNLRDTLLPNLMNGGIAIETVIRARRI